MEIGMNAHVETPSTATTIHRDGIYFSMPDTEYHADPALGSTGLKKLVSNAPDFWWDSPMNPVFEPENNDTAAKIFGRQLHTCVLEGREKFTARHAPQMNPGNVKAGKEEIESIRASGKTPVKFAEYQRILAASSFIRANSFLRNAFDGGQPEVSVFWTVDGIRFKARFDYLKMNAITDLKSIRSKGEKPFKQQCTDAVGSYEYTISAEHYCEGRRQMARLIKAGAVFNAPAEDDDFNSWLIQVAGNKTFAFVFVFWKAEGAPVSKGFKLSPGNPLFAYARASIGRAVHNYQTFMSEFGTDAAWVPSEPIEELDETDLPVWYQQRLMTGE